MTYADDLRFMRRALELAAYAKGETSPNPMVGCVLVKEGKIIAEGYHRRAGEPHAELEALRQAKEDVRGAEVFVNLEPCNHYGRTGPCTAALIEAGVRRVVVGMIDPNPKVSGAGISALRDAGITVEVGLLEEEAQTLNEAFARYITRNLPFVTLKVAQTLDGKIATSTGDARWVTGPEARRLVHELRAEVDGILTGVGTVLADDPQLTVRDASRRQGPKGPLRIILDSSLRTPPTARLFQEPGPKVILAATAPDPKKRDLLEQAGAEVWEISPGPNGRVDLRSLLQKLAAHGLTHILVEGGAAVNGAFLDEGLVDKLYLFYAPKILGAADAIPSFAGKERPLLKMATSLTRLSFTPVGEDFLLVGYINR